MSHSERFTDKGRTSVFYDGMTAGRLEERERIIKLLEQDVCPDWTIRCCDGACSAYKDAIALIKGEPL